MKPIPRAVDYSGDAGHHRDHYHAAATTAQEINARAVTVGDYTIAVSGLGKNKHSREALAAMSHYGEWRPSCTSRTSARCSRRTTSRRRDSSRSSSRKQQRRTTRAWALLFRAFCGGNPTPKNIAKPEKKVEELQKAIAELAKKPENIASS